MFTADYQDQVTYWQNLGTDGWGDRSFAAPVVLMCRWEEIAEKFLMYDGEQKVSKAVVYIPQLLAIGDYLYRGLTSQVNPTVLPGAYEIKQIMEIPDLRRAFKERRAFL